MQVIIDNENVVIFFFDDENLQIKNGLIVNRKMYAPFIRNESHSIMEAIEPPARIGGAYKLINGTYIVHNQELITTYIESLKPIKKQEIKQAFEADTLAPIVDTGLGFSVNGAYKNKTDFETGKKYAFPQVRASDNTMHNVTTADYDTIISAIELNGIGLYQKKWALEAQVDLATTIEELGVIKW